MVVYKVVSVAMHLCVSVVVSMYMCVVVHFLVFVSVRVSACACLCDTPMQSSQFPALSIAQTIKENQNGEEREERGQKAT